MATAANAISNFNAQRKSVDSESGKQYWADRIQDLYDATRPVVEKTRRNTRKAAR